jgi:xanthine dehydrogenase FAD-binding subunit
VDLNTVRSVRLPRDRSDLRLSPGESFLAGGTWLYSEPQAGVTGLVDLTVLDWPALEVTSSGLTIAATCTLLDLVQLAPQPGWSAQSLFAQCVHSLAASWKIFGSATVGGNLCTTLPAASLIGLTAGLDGTAVIWTPDGGERRLPVVDFVLGAQQNALRPGELLRSVELDHAALTSRTAHRKIALTTLGRTGSLVIGRRGTAGETVFTITGATPRPHQLRYPHAPDAETLRRDVAASDDWYDDPHGSPRWRAHVTAVLAEEIRQELS